MKRKFFAYPYIVWMILFIVAPMLFILYYAVNVGGEWTITKAWATLSDAGKWHILWTRTYAWSAIIEYAIPDLLGLAKSITATPAGRTLAVLLVLVYDFLPFMVLPLYNTLSKLDKSLLEAARDLGADGRTAFMRVVLPLSVPGIVSGITMVFVPAITAFTVPALIGMGNYSLYGNVIDNAFKIHPQYAIGSTLSIVLLLFVLVSTVIMNYFDTDKEGGSIL